MAAKQNYKQLVQDVNIKSKYLSNIEMRRLVVNPQLSQITISKSGQPENYKEFHIDQLKDHQVQGNRITLNFDNGRNYQIEAEKPNRISRAITHSRNIQLCSKFTQQNINVIPVSINYAPARIINPPKSENQKTIHIPFRNYASLGQQAKMLPQHSMKVVEIKKQRDYKKMPYFINPADWEINSEEGYLYLLNQEWKSNTLKIFTFVLKKFIANRTFMGISFPVFAMKTQSILQTYAKSVATAPNIFTNTRDQLQRFKQFSFFLWSFSLLQVAIVKPFNPVIGQTFQADICGGRYSAEQVCHHPPISAFYFQKDNYKIHASLQLSASIGVNSGEGRFIGDITIQYDDKYWIKGKLPNGEMTGILFGTTTFQTFGGSYIYDSRNLVLTYNFGKNNTFQGYLGFLNFQTSKKFVQILKNNERFLKFKGYSKQQYTKVVSNFTAKYTQWVAYDNKIYSNLHDPKIFPYQLEQPLNQQILKSDSRHRKDIQLLKEKEVDKSQQEKERIQNEERFFRKLREQYTK